MNLQRKARTVHAVDCDLVKRKASKHFLFISDVHFDAMKCDRAMLFRHLDEARELNAGVFIFGDLFDLMQGKWDPRGNYSELRPEYKSCVYVDEVIQDVGEHLAKYADVIKVISKGNHETNIEKRMMVSPIDRVAQIINANGGHVEVGGYAGWLVVQTHRGGSARRRYNINYHHGYGGGAKRSKGILGADIDQKDFPDADFILRGPDHQKWHLPVTIDRITQSMKLEQRTVHHLRLGSYKKLGDRFAGWATERNFATPRLGGWWARVTERRDDYVWEVREAT
jgi:hypothetical protein